MPSLALRSIAAATALMIAAAAFVGPAAAPPGDTYAAMVKAISGAVAVAGAAGLARAIGRTWLQSTGNAAFKAAYMAAAALCGLGAAEAASALWPLNVGHALAACSAVSTVSGLMWVRFYDRAA